jgi:tRNA-uridine 2-sulfurtransferase
VVSDRTKRRSPAPVGGYGTRVAERLRTSDRGGRLDAPDAAGEAGSSACGALVRIELALVNGLIRDARYQAYGCPTTLASAAEVAARSYGVSVLAAAGIGEDDVISSLGLAGAKERSAELAVEALQAALTDVISSGLNLAAPDVVLDRDGVLVGMSGGVDSTVAALLLLRQGFRVVGATLRLWDEGDSSGERSCCSPETVRRARRAAHSLGIPHITVDASDQFYRTVVKYFLEEYAAARTPNPCAKCNARVRFGLLLDVARRLGLSRVATGHYARLYGQSASLARGVDHSKDQSYVLAEVDPDILRNVVFPLGGMTKVEVRELAAEEELEGHGVPESQEICFVPDDDHRRFLREHLGERPGDIVDRQGRVVGGHAGAYNFTIGQRKGLGIAALEPLYVTDLDADRNEVVVGSAFDLDVSAIKIGSLTHHGSDPIRRGSLQIRSAGATVAACLMTDGSEDNERYCEKEVEVLLEQAISGVALGQTAVVYDGDRVVLAGTIVGTDRTQRAESRAVTREKTGPVI